MQESIFLSGNTVLDLAKVGLCGVGISNEGFAQNQELSVLVISVGVGAVAEGLGQLGISVVYGDFCDASQLGG